ncbi:hypothetical protein JWJ90_20265 [Desulfobulbus rhabdoformis]|uniref:tetratricopeptide repeat protein n=1 Tax=Desulfobulbus rhabdoformis TaxID=34032 RepID=UPI0019661FC6|nr:hypothetical protein [Desulfobulbus rhabdoformis]MBM9616605.1 hypothetical protein [Desulfobulbus rhabdoformis]
MTLVETEPTVANMRRLAALRASRSRDLLRYAEEHQDSAAFDLALHYAQSAGELDPSSTGIKLLQATLYSRAQDLPFAAQLAEGLLLDILSTEPEQDQARQLLAELYFTQAEFGSAIDQFEYLLQHEVPLEGRQLAMLVDAYAASGEVTRGRLFLRKHLKHQNPPPSLHLAAALLAHHAKDQATAMGQLERVIRSPRTEKQYRLYAQQLKTIWSGEENQ